MKVLASNKKAYFNFEILEKFEAGIVLKGWEVKAIKASRVSFSGSYIKPIKSELFLEGTSVHQLKYSLPKGNEEQNRSRKLLLKRKEIDKITAGGKMKGNTSVPLEIVEDNKGLVKVVVALVRGRKKFDKRQKLKEREMAKKINFERKKYNF